MGTAELSGTSLAALARDQKFHVVAAVTQPDKPKGRELKLQPSPVKSLALKLGLPVLQPERARDEKFITALRELKPDLIVVVAYGQLLPPALLDLPRHGCLNVHTSLLPKYRGAAPLNWQIIRGETKTGVTIMLMDEGMDSGDILLQEETPLGANETYGDLHDRLAQLGAELLIKTIEQVVDKTAKLQPQDAAAMTIAPRLKKETGKIDWQNSASVIVNHIRGLSPTPTAYTLLEGQVLKIFTAEAGESKIPGKISDAPGTIGMDTAGGITVAASDGCVILKDVQLAGKKKMSAKDFLRGYRLKPGTFLE